jgi:hypothetical protein
MSDTLVNPTPTKVSKLAWVKDIFFDKTVTHAKAAWDKAYPAEDYVGLEDDPQSQVETTLETSTNAPILAPATVHEPRVNSQHIWAGAFLEAYGFDGFDLPSTKVTYNSGDKKQVSDGKFSKTEPALYNGKKLTPLLAFATFLGLPTRTASVGVDGIARLNWRQIVRNIFGGWNPIPRKNPLTQKMKWNVAFIPVKIVIAIIKVALILPKIALNIVKLFTEFLPSVLMNYSGKWTGILAHKAGKKFAQSGVLAKVVGSLLLVPIAIVGAVHTAFRLVTLVGRTLTSPEKSARLAWAYGRSFGTDKRGNPTTRATKTLGILLGGLAATLSIALTAILWMIALPLLVSEAVILVPQLVPLLTSISQLPVVAASLTFAKGTVALVLGSLPAAFSTAATGFAAMIGLNVSATAVAVGTTIAAIAAPTTTIASRLADELSNSWARWKTDGMINWINSAFPKTRRKQGEVDKSAAEDSSPEKGNKLETSPNASPETLRLAQVKRDAEKSANANAENLDGIEFDASKHPKTATTSATKDPVKDDEKRLEDAGLGAPGNN